MEEFKKQYKLPLENTTYSHVFDAKANMVMEISNDELRDKLVRVINGEDLEINVAKPVVYAPTKILDANGKEIISIRGWGRLGKLPNGAEIQDSIGAEIAWLINGPK